MGSKLSLDDIYALSENVVAREIAGEFIIIPLTSAVGDSDEEIFSLNETGRAIWRKFNGRRKLRETIRELRRDFYGSPEKIEKDCLGLMEELLKRKMIVKVKDE